jgi:hypothetical protein
MPVADLLFVELLLLLLIKLRTTVRVFCRVIYSVIYKSYEWERSSLLAPSANKKKRWATCSSDLLGSAVALDYYCILAVFY